MGDNVFLYIRTVWQSSFLPGNMGTGILCFSVKILKMSSVTGVFKGAWSMITVSVGNSLTTSPYGRIILICISTKLYNMDSTLVIYYNE